MLIPVGILFGGAIIGGAAYTTGVLINNAMRGKGVSFEGWKPLEFGLNVALGAITGGIADVAAIAVKETILTAGEAVLFKATGSLWASAAKYNYSENKSEIAASQSLTRSVVNIAVGSVSPVATIGSNAVLDIVANLPVSKEPLMYSQSIILTPTEYDEAAYQKFSGVLYGSESSTATSTTGMSNVDAYSSYQSGNISYSDYVGVIKNNLGW